MGIADLVVNYYTALPGTEIFNSLYDSGDITFDKKYFSHILLLSGVIKLKKMPKL